MAGKERKLALVGGDRAAHWQRRALAWGDTLQALLAAWKLHLDQLPAQRSALDKPKLAAAMMRATSVSNGWLAERLQMGPAASASQYVRRVRLTGGDRTAEFQRVLSKVKA